MADDVQYVQLPDGSYLKFPASMPDKDIELAVNKVKAQNIDVNIKPAERAGTAQTPEGSSTGRFLEGAAKNLNPVTAVTGLASAVMHPVDTAKAQWDALEEHRGKAYELAKQGRYTEAVGQFAAGTIPFLGPAAASAGERIASGDVAGGIGEGTGLVAPVAAPAALSAARAGITEAASGAARAMPGTAERIAVGADKMANERITKVVAPRVGANKARFTNMAMEAAPDLARRTTALSRGGIYEQVSTGLQRAEGSLDAASDARLSAAAVDPSGQGVASARKINTPSLLDALEAKKSRLTMKAVEAERIPPTKSNLNSSGQETVRTTTSGEPYGQDVVPNAYRQRVAKVQEAIDAIKKLGPTTTYDNLRLLRQAYDQEAKPIYSPALTSDYMKKLGEAQGAADITGSVRDFLAKIDPSTATANAEYSMWRNAHDVLRAAEETELTRPTIGRTMLARGLGGAVGASEGGATGAIVGAITGPLVERIANGAAPSIQLVAARQLAQLADALRAGQVTRAGNALLSLKNLAGSVKLKATVAGNTISAGSAAPVPTGP